MKLSVFLAYMLVLTAGCMQFYAAVRETFNGNSEYKAEIARLHYQIKENRIAHALDKEQFLEFRQYVATLMPETLKQKGQGEAGYPIRGLASVVSNGDATQIRAAIAKTLFERGKVYFRDKKFDKAIHNFQQIVDHFGYTPYVRESYFLMAESRFQQSDYEDCTQIIHRMVDLFPSDELTGFALVRLGRIYQIQNRTEDAVDIYKTVLRTFPQRDVASQAKASLRGTDL
jgi:TolA-binding protein